MGDFVFKTELNVLQCYKCGIFFAIPKEYEANRRDDGAVFYCPNQHALSWPGIAPRSELRDQLDAEKTKLAKLQMHNIQLTARLDQAEATLAEQKPLNKDSGADFEDSEVDSGDSA